MTISMKKRRKCTSWIFIFLNSSQRYLQNMFRDFRKSRNNEKWENGPFSKPFFYQKHLDMANEKYLMTIGMEKWRKCTSQIFDFWKFIAHKFAKLVEIFSKIMNLWKIWKLSILLALFRPYMVEYYRQK